MLPILLCEVLSGTIGRVIGSRAAGTDYQDQKEKWMTLPKVGQLLKKQLFLNILKFFFGNDYNDILQC